MCYSAQILSEYRKFERAFGAGIDIKRYVELFWEKRKQGGWNKLPKAMRHSFSPPRNAGEMELAKLVAEGDRERAEALEREIDEQTARLEKARAVMASARPTKKAADDQRIAGNKIRAAQRQLDDLRRKEPMPDDSRIFPGSYAPVMIMQDNKRVVVPMRYQCRLPGWNAGMERKYPGTYNARRDKLEESWGKLFGHFHGVMVANVLYENVARHAMEQRELAEGERPENVVLEFRPEPPQDMLIACLWSFSPGMHGEADLFSFAAVTDDPPPEVVAAGHDRFVIPIKPENLDAWLKPNPNDLRTLYDILDDRPRPYYEHRIAA